MEFPDDVDAARDDLPTRLARAGVAVYVAPDPHSPALSAAALEALITDILK